MVIEIFTNFSNARSETATFHFAALGSSFSAALPADSPLIGGEITSARIYLDVETFPGSDAANFFTDISFPIESFPGNTNAFVLAGVDLGWSSAGTFHYFEETTRFNGLFAPYRYGGETRPRISMACSSRPPASSSITSQPAGAPSRWSVRPCAKSTAVTVTSMSTFR